jgi:hypothetical protein
MALGELLVQDSTRINDSDDAWNTNRSEVGVNTYLYELRGERSGQGHLDLLRIRRGARTRQR